MNSKAKDRWVIFGMGALCLVLLISHTLYVIKTYQYPAGGLDEHVYLSMAVNFYDSLKEPSFWSISEIINFDRYRQPLYGIFLGLPLLLFGTAHTYKIALWMNIIFYLTTVISTYFLGREFLSKKASFFAAFLFAFYGFPLFYLHFTYSETAVTSFIVLALLFLAKSKNFSNVKQTFLFSVFFIIGNLIRWVVPIFVGGPLFLSLLVSVVNQIKEKTRDIKNFSLNTAIFLLLGILPVLILYYIPNHSFFSKYISSNTQNASNWITQFYSPELQGLRNPFSTHSIIFYFNIISQQTIFFLLLFIVGFCIAVFHFKKYAFFLLAFVVAYGVFTFGSVTKQDRYIVPIYPIVALISAITFDYIKNKKLGFSLIAFTLIIGSLNFLGASWGIGPMQFSVTGSRYVLPNSVLIPMPIGHPRRIWLAPISWPPRSNESNVYQIIKVLRDDWGNQKTPFRLLVTFETSQVNDHLFSIFTYEQRGVMTWHNLVGIPKDRYDIFFQRIRDVDYVVVKNGSIDRGYVEGKDTGWDNYIYLVRKFNKAMQLSGGRLPKAFTPIATISIPFDKSELIIYKKQREIAHEEWEKFGELLIRANPESTKVIKSAIDSLVN